MRNYAAFLTFLLLCAVATWSRAAASECNAPPAESDIGSLSVYLRDPAEPLSAVNDPNYHGALLQFSGCLNYHPTFKEKFEKEHYYSGSVTVAYFDKSGRYLGSNGQALNKTVGVNLDVTANHKFGAGIALGYNLTDVTKVSNHVLIEVTLTDCATSDPESCQPTQKSYLVWLNTEPDAKAEASDMGTDSPKPTCARPLRLPLTGPAPSDSPKSDAESGDELFGLWAEGLLQVADDPVTAKKQLTHLGFLACLRLIPKGNDRNDEVYYGQALVYIFDKYGRVLGLGNEPLAIGGQQLGLLDTPNPKIFGDEKHDGFFFHRAALHDFGVTLSTPLRNHADIDRHVLLAVTIVCKRAGTKCDAVPHTYYKVIDTCAPGLPDGDKIKIALCPDYQAPPP